MRIVCWLLGHDWVVMYTDDDVCTRCGKVLPYLEALRRRS